MLHLLLARRFEQSLPGARGDLNKLAVVVEGGGMRASCSGGMIAALERLGLHAAVDVVYGASAGALNAAFFLSGQAAMGCTMYVEDLPNLRVINPYRMMLPFGRRPAVDMEYILDHVYRDVKPLNIEAVLGSTIPLHVNATDVADGRSIDFVGAESWEVLRAWLLASTRVPVLTGRPVEINGARYIDATLSDGIPYRRAIADGATHVLVLRSRRHQRKAAFASGPERWFMAGALRSINPDLLPLLEGRQARSAHIGEELMALTSAPGEEPPYVYAIEPPSDVPQMHQLSRSAAAARQAVNAGYRATVEALGVEPDELLRGSAAQ